MNNPKGRKIKQVIQRGVACLETRFKQWARPATSQQVIGTLADLKRNKSELMAENMFLHQQVIVLDRQVTRPKLTQGDRQLFVLLASRIRGWWEALIGWHRLGFKLFSRRKSRVRQGRPQIAEETIALIEEMAIHNRTWRARRIQGSCSSWGSR